MLLFISPKNEVAIRKECKKTALEKCIFSDFCHSPSNGKYPLRLYAYLFLNIISNRFHTISINFPKF